MHILEARFLKKPGFLRLNPPLRWPAGFAKLAANCAI